MEGCEKFTILEAFSCDIRIPAKAVWKLSRGGNEAIIKGTVQYITANHRARIAGYKTEGRRPHWEPQSQSPPWLGRHWKASTAISNISLIPTGSRGNKVYEPDHLVGSRHSNVPRPICPYEQQLMKGHTCISIYQVFGCVDWWCREACWWIEGSQSFLPLSLKRRMCAQSAGIKMSWKILVGYSKERNTQTFSCIHRIAGSFLILSCFVAFWGVPPQPLQLYTPAISLSGDVKLSRHPLSVGVDNEVNLPMARFFACTWTSRLRSTIGSSVRVTFPHWSQVTLLRSLP